MLLEQASSKGLHVQDQLGASSPRVPARAGFIMWRAQYKMKMWTLLAETREKVPVTVLKCKTFPLPQSLHLLWCFYLLFNTPRKIKNLS